MNIDELVDVRVWEDLPEDPDEAFAAIIRVAQFNAKERFERLARSAADDDDYSHLQDAQLGFIGCLIGVAKGLDVIAFKDYDIPDASNFNHSYYRRFIADLSHFSAQVAARRAVRTRQLSVRLDPKVAGNIRVYVHHLKEAIDASTLSKAKKANLHAKIREFEAALDSGKRINIMMVSLLIMEIVGIPGSVWATGDLVGKLTQNITQAIAEARHVEAEEKASLTTEPVRAIAPPVRQQPVKRVGHDLNDDIPF